MTTTTTIKSDAVIGGIHRLYSSATISAKRYSLVSNGYIIEPTGSILCDGQMVDNIVDEFGTDVWLRVVTKSFDDEYGDATETYSDHRIPALVQSYSASDDEVKEGVFKAGEIIFTFRKTNESLIKPGAKVRYGQVWYEIRQVMKQPLVDILYYLQARVQKI